MQAGKRFISIVLAAVLAINIGLQSVMTVKAEEVPSAAVYELSQNEGAASQPEAQVDAQSELQADIDLEQTQVVATSETATKAETAENEILDTPVTEDNVVQENEISTPEDAQTDADWGIAMFIDSDYSINNVEELKTAMGEYGVLTIKTDDGQTVIDKLTINGVQALILLSNTNPQLYQTAVLERNATGDAFDLTQPLVYDGTTLNFRGLGSAEFPFKGSLGGNNTWSFKLNRALFGCVASSASIAEGLSELTLQYVGDGQQSVFADTFLFDAEIPSANWKLNVNIMAPANFTGTELSSGALIGTLGSQGGTSGTLALSGTTWSYDNSKTLGVTGTENAGLLCNTILSGTLNASGVTLPTTAYTVTASAGSAGGLVGQMAAETGLTLGDSTVIQNAAITGTTNAGGLVGEATDIALTSAENGKISISNTTIKASNAVTEEQTTQANVGGLFGSYTCTDTYNTFSTINEKYTLGENVSLETAAGGNAGGLFGLLTVNKNTTGAASSFAIDYALATATPVISTVSGASGTETYGGLIGSYATADISNTLSITGPSGATVDVATSTLGKALSIYGGLVGNVGDTAYVVLKDVAETHTLSGDAPTTFGGMVGQVGKNSLLNFTGIVTAKGTYKSSSSGAAGGLVGSVGAGTAVRLSGTTTVSGKVDTVQDNAGQLIGKQESSLIYATGDWVFQRPAAQRVDDIGNYGQVIRLSTDNAKLGTEGSTKTPGSLITFDEMSHSVKISHAVPFSDVENTITIGAEGNDPVLDFAATAIAIQSNGSFKNEGTTATTENLLAANIVFNANVDMSGTGIQGLLRDNGDQFYTGSSLSGGDATTQHTIMLAVGEAYGKRGTADVTTNEEGSGQIYRHCYLGLIAASKSANLTVKNLTMAGKMDFGVDADNTTYAGGVIGQAGGGTVAFENVKTGMGITWDGSAMGGIGGILGQLSAGTGARFGAENAPCQMSATMTYKGTSDKPVAGGLVGTVSGATMPDRTVTFANVKLSQSGQMLNTKSYANVKMGGLIGTLEHAEQATSVDVQKIQINGFQMKQQATSTAGGLLGYDWRNANVTFKGNGLVVANATELTVTGNAGFGGLVQKATGHWAVESTGVQLQSLTITSSSSGSCGLLVYDGRPDAQSQKNYALYLELLKSDSYRIASAASISVTSKNVDELVYKTASSADNVLVNGQSVISIATADNLGIDQEETTCNTYQNQTAQADGEAWNKNANSRYYYNLTAIRTAAQSANNANNGVVDTADELMMWELYHYAASELKQYFTIGTDGAAGDAGCTTIGSGDKEKPATIDLKGYSYYPMDVPDDTVVIGAVIKFYNKEIETAEAPTTNGLDSYVRATNQKTQHYLLHFGLFRNFKGSADTSTVTKSFKVQGLTLGGTIGCSDDYSGALLCGTVQGDNKNGIIKTQRVDLNGLVLDDLYIYKNGLESVLKSKFAQKT